MKGIAKYGMNMSMRLKILDIFNFDRIKICSKHICIFFLCRFALSNRFDQEFPSGLAAKVSSS